MNLNDLIAGDRWLINSGLINENVQQNLLGYAHLCFEHGAIKDPEVVLDLDKKTIVYHLFLSRSHLRKYQRYCKWVQFWSTSKSLLGRYIYVRLLERNRENDIERLLSKWTKEYMGPQFVVTVKLQEWKG